MTMPRLLPRAAGMRRALLACATLIGVALLPQVALAQQRVGAGGLKLDGFWATCGPVQTEIRNMTDIAASSGGRIILNPLLFSYPRAQQIFWYTHECGHQIFGASETTADCWAAEQGRIQGWLDSAEFEKLLKLINLLPGDAAHAAGPTRAGRLRRCFYR